MTGTVLDAVAAATPAIRRALLDDRDTSGGTNPSGDRTTAADRAVDDLLFDRLRDLDAVGTYASEERADPVDCGAGYAVTVDPVDGSSNLRSNNALGTVLGVYDAALPARGRDLVASALVVYGPRTTVTAAADGNATTWDVVDGDRVAPQPVELPADHGVCGVSGAGDEWPCGVHDLLSDADAGFNLRYTGAMAADVMHLLDRGGVLCYPALPSTPGGVLRLQYESNPVAHLVETAGGASSDGTESLLDRPPGDFHERVPTFLGTPSLVERAADCF